MKKQTEAQRRYLYELARNVVGATTVRDPHMDRVGAICYIYGAEMRHCHVADWRLKIKHDFDDVVGSMLEPWSYIIASGKPLFTYHNEDNVVLQEFQKIKQSNNAIAKYLDWKGEKAPDDLLLLYAYLGWPTKEGDTVRAQVTHALKKCSKSPAYKSWEKKRDVFNALFEKWTDAYQKEYPKTTLKFYGVYDDGSVAISVKKAQANKKRHTLSKDERFAIWKKYNEELEQFANFLEERFLNGDTLFPDNHKRI